MKILHVYKNYRPETQGGAEQVITDICEGTVREGHTADVFVTANVDSLKRANWLNHGVIQARRTFELSSTPISFEMLRKFDKVASNYDLINFHFPWPLMDVLYEMSKQKLPYIVTYHSDIIKQKKLLKLYKPLMLRFLNRAAAVVATSENYLKTSSVLSEVRAPKKVIPLGINPPNSEALAEEEIGSVVQGILNANEQFFVFVGVLRYYKGLKFLIEAASSVASKIVIAGDGPERSALNELAKRKGVNNVTFIGRINDAEKQALLDNALGFVFPSHERSEAFGISLLEASAASLPMVTCEIGTGTSFVNLNSQTGFVVPPRDPQALANALQRLSTDPLLASRMGAAANKRFRANFTAKQMSLKYLNLYESILSGA